MNTITAVALTLIAVAMGAFFSWVMARSRANRSLQAVKDDFIAKLNAASRDIAQLEERCARIPELQKKL